MERDYSSYRWAMMFFLFLGTSAQGLIYMSTPPMEIPVSDELGLSAIQIAILVNIAFVMSIVLSIPAGALSDRFELKKYMGVGFVLLGLFALLRGFTNSFAALMAASALSSIGWVIFFTSLPRIINSWFPPREVGTAMGIVFAGYGVGSAAGIAFAQPLFGDDWRRCFAVFGVWGIIAAGIWWIGARKSPQPEKGKSYSGGPVNIASGLGEVMRVKTLWRLIIIFFFYLGGRAVWLTFSFPYLVTMRGMSESITGFVLLMDWVGYIAGASVAAVLSDKLGLRRPFFFVFGAALGALFLVLPFITSFAAAAVYALAVGLSFGAINPMIFVVCAESQDIGPERTGSATGVMICFANIGALVIPTLAGYILGTLKGAAMADYRWVWLLVALALIMIAFFTSGLKETGARMRNPAS